jgi:hypothetical protein
MALKCLRLPLHKTKTPHPLDRTLFKPIKIYHHQETQPPNATTTKFHFGKPFSGARIQTERNYDKFGSTAGYYDRYNTP